MSRKPQDLPTEVLENVLARLPVHVLCRFRIIGLFNQVLQHPSGPNCLSELPTSSSRWWTFWSTEMGLGNAGHGGEADLQTDHWRYINVELPKSCHPQEISLLVVCLGRLFFIEYTGFQLFSFNHRTTWEILLAKYQQIDPFWTSKDVIKVSVWEILLTEEEVVKVVEMPKYSLYLREFVERSYRMSDELVAVGCGDSIIISFQLGRCVASGLLKNCWHELSGKFTFSCSSDGSRNGIVAGIFVLDLRDMEELSPRTIVNGLTG